MFKYLIKRILIFIPTLFAISLVTFIISINAPGDPVETMLNTKSNNDGQASQKLATEKAYNDLKHQLGLDLPFFYFSITNATVHDTVYKIPKRDERETIERLAYQYGKWNNVASYFNNIRKFEYELLNFKKNESNSENLRKLKNLTNTLYITYEEEKTSSLLSEMKFIAEKDNEFISILPHFKALWNTYESMVHEQEIINRYIPKVIYYGLNNQYHVWLFGNKPWFSGEDAPGLKAGFVRGDFGISYQDKRPVSSIIFDALRWTVMMSILSIIIAYAIAIPLGVKSAVKKGTKTEKVITSILFIFYSMPNFWVATILIIYFCGGDYFDWFPAFGVGVLPESMPFFDRFLETAHHLILPLFCWTYASFAFISRQMRGGMLNILGQDFIRTARAKGLDENTITWKHAFRNSLLPIITLFANIFPLAIAGSFVIEYIFSIPGMGKVSFEALVARNYPIVFTVMMLTGILTLAGTLFSDILYALIDPRISFSDKKN
jgi:peptide/nickel transport system permease protein